LTRQKYTVVDIIFFKCLHSQTIKIPRDKKTNKIVEPGPGDILQCEQCGLQRLVAEVTNLRVVEYGADTEINA
jgi:hypothetical protein